ncbi:multiple sugar transport system permease protein [Streptomyces sp. SAI-144]|uniref:carbohydrate ABC transporter permease n=1 Tax=Streptomyces sp. SAI-144 TaxID=2940544 RepID=UPI002474680F|nr:sugar ABC transporter permease [Streptomyces sp. SAI-144]MDH6434273.1 multiple sugar transport system permease protein [Streptomyces sp. SAI-144]MDH6490354.1 multiple sugar transport system permease protein [Streptomyces sp. SAI-127]
MTTHQVDVRAPVTSAQPTEHGSRRHRPRAGSPRSPLERRTARLGWLFASPALLVVAAVTLFPIVFSVVMSFSNVDVTGNGFQLSGITGHNFAVIAGADRWRHALAFTLVYTVGTVIAEVVLGTLIALVLERLKSGRGWMMALLLLPWAMITVVSAQLWAYVYNGVYGVLNALLAPLAGHDVTVLGTPVSATLAMAVADIWKTTPFVAIIVLAGLVMLPSDVIEAARIDGANGWTIFWRVRLPLLRPTLAIAVMFRVLQAFGLFDLPFVLTGGGPGTSTESLAVLGWRVMFQDLKFGPGAAIATSTAVLVLIGCLLFLKVFRSQVGQEETA